MGPDDAFNPVNSGIAGVRQDDNQNSAPWTSMIQNLMGQMTALNNEPMPQAGPNPMMQLPGMQGMMGGGMPGMGGMAGGQQPGGGRGILASLMQGLGSGLQGAGLAAMPPREFGEMSGQMQRGKAQQQSELMRLLQMQVANQAEQQRFAMQERNQRRMGLQNQLADALRMQLMQESSDKTNKTLQAGVDRLEQQQKFQAGETDKKEAFQAGENEKNRRASEERQQSHERFLSAQQSRLFAQQDQRDAERWAMQWKMMEQRNADKAANKQPTADEKRRADLANNVSENLDRLEEIITRRPDLLGKFSGRLTSLRGAIGTSDPDISQLPVIREQLGIASIGAHAMRNFQGAERLGKVLSSLYNSPQAALAAIGAARDSLKTFQTDVGEPGGTRPANQRNPQQPQMQPSHQPVATPQPGTMLPPGAKVIKFDDYLKEKGLGNAAKQ